MIVRFTYGHEADSEFLELAKQVNTHTAIALQPGRWMVNYFPLRKSNFIIPCFQM